MCCPSEGVGDVTSSARANTAMRIWLDPDQIRHAPDRHDVVQALPNKSAVQWVIPAPVPQGSAYQLSVNTLGD